MFIPDPLLLPAAFPSGKDSPEKLKIHFIQPKSVGGRAGTLFPWDKTVLWERMGSILIGSVVTSTHPARAEPELPSYNTALLPASPVFISLENNLSLAYERTREPTGRVTYSCVLSLGKRPRLGGVSRDGAGDSMRSWTRTLSGAAAAPPHPHPTHHHPRHPALFLIPRFLDCCVGLSIPSI